MKRIVLALAVVALLVFGAGAIDQATESVPVEAVQDLELVGDAAACDDITVPCYCSFQRWHPGDWYWAWSPWRGWYMYQGPPYFYWVWEPCWNQW